MFIVNKTVLMGTAFLVAVSATPDSNSGNCNNLEGNWYYEETYGSGAACPGNFYYRY